MQFIKLIKLYFQRNFVFRLNFVMSWLTTILRFSFTILFWLSAMKTKNSNFEYSSAQMIIYFFIIMLIGLFIRTDVTDRISGSIYSGNLATDILKPISPHKLYFTNCMAMKLIMFTVLIISSIVLIFIPDYSGLFSVSLLLSLIINFELSYMIGLLSFWTNVVWGISMINSVLMDVFGGRLFPIAIAGPIMKKICAILPYQYIYYVPTQVLEQKMDCSVILIQIVYALALFLLNKLLFKSGTKHFEAVGV